MAQHKPVASDNYYKSTRKIQIWQLSFAPIEAQAQAQNNSNQM